MVSARAVKREVLLPYVIFSKPQDRSADTFRSDEEVSLAAIPSLIDWATASVFS